MVERFIERKLKENKKTCTPARSAPPSVTTTPPTEEMPPRWPPRSPTSQQNPQPKPLSPRSEFNQSCIILQRLIEARCLPPKYLGVLRGALEADKRCLSAPTTPAPEEAAQLERYETMPIPGTRRKRPTVTEGEPEEEAKRLCANPPPPLRYPSACPNQSP